MTAFSPRSSQRKEPGRPELPRDVTIATWNYDTQLERSYSEFCEDPEWVAEDITRAKNIVRLNGLCGQPYKKDKKDLNHINFDSSFFELVIDLFEKQLDPDVVGYRPLISFAWEREDVEETVTKALSETTTVVVIGYSFPYFNRDIDKFLYMVMRNSLNKIFVQVPEKDQIGVQERLLTLVETDDTEKFVKEKMRMVRGTELFYIPDDMPI